MEAKLKHLEMIQAVITRMAHNSFLLKGWSVTISAAVLAVMAGKPGSGWVVIALVPTLFFWGLDGYFLRQERLFRELYDHVRELEPDKVDFSMDTRPYQNEVDSWFQVAVSRTLLAFYLPMVALIILVTLYAVFS